MKHWEMSQAIKPGCNESQLTELSDGTLLMNMRSYNGRHSRAISTSKDGGATWSEISHDPQLVELGRKNANSMWKYENANLPGFTKAKRKIARKLREIQREQARRAA